MCLSIPSPLLTCKCMCSGYNRAYCVISAPWPRASLHCYLANLVRSGEKPVVSHVLQKRGRSSPADSSTAQPLHLLPSMAGLQEPLPVYPAWGAPRSEVCHLESTVALPKPPVRAWKLVWWICLSIHLGSFNAALSQDKDGIMQDKSERCFQLSEVVLPKRQNSKFEWDFEKKP